MTQGGLTEMTCHHISEQATQSHRHRVWESRGGWPHTQARDVYLCEAGGGKQGSTAWKLLNNESSNSQLVVFCLTSDQSSITFFCF